MEGPENRLTLGKKVAAQLPGSEGYTQTGAEMKAEGQSRYQPMTMLLPWSYASRIHLPSRGEYGSLFQTHIFSVYFPVDCFFKHRENSHSKSPHSCRNLHFPRTLTVSKSCIIPPALKVIIKEPKMYRNIL